MQRGRWMLTSLSAVFFLAVLALPALSTAAPLLGGSAVVASDGEVVAKFISQAAGFDNELFLDTPANGLGRIFHNHINSPGDMVSLGIFTGGTELIFRLHVVNTGNDFFTGPGPRNPDGIPHAVVDDAFAPGETSVGFEDLFGGGDRDFDDTVFSFTNVRGTPIPPGPPGGPVPEPGSLLLLGSGLVGLAYRSLKRKSS